MGAKLDLNKAHLTRQHGDILAVYTWVNDERALVLIPAYRKGAAWYIVCESAAYQYDNPEYLARQSAKAAEVLGMEPSSNNWVRIATIIHDGLPDLIEMPSVPEPVLMRATVGEMRMFENGRLIAGEEIRMERDEGAIYGAC
jgi:hypothetical protein